VDVGVDVGVGVGGSVGEAVGTGDGVAGRGVGVRTGAGGGLVGDVVLVGDGVIAGARGGFALAGVGALIGGATNSGAPVELVAVGVSTGSSLATTDGEGAIDGVGTGDGDGFEVSSSWPPSTASAGVSSGWPLAVGPPTCVGAGELLGPNVTAAAMTMAASAARPEPKRRGPRAREPIRAVLARPVGGVGASPRSMTDIASTAAAAPRHDAQPEA